MSQPVGKAGNYSERTNNEGAKSGAKVKILNGPTAGKKLGNAGQGGGIYRATKKPPGV